MGYIDQRQIRFMFEVGNIFIHKKLIINFIIIYMYNNIKFITLYYEYELSVPDM